jgi:hypothetical protein
MHVGASQGSQQRLRLVRRIDESGTMPPMGVETWEKQPCGSIVARAPRVTYWIQQACQRSVSNVIGKGNMSFVSCRILQMSRMTWCSAARQTFRTTTIAMYLLCNGDHDVHQPHRCWPNVTRPSSPFDDRVLAVRFDILLMQAPHDQPRRSSSSRQRGHQ